MKLCAQIFSRLYSCFPDTILSKLPTKKWKSFLSSDDDLDRTFPVILKSITRYKVAQEKFFCKIFLKVFL